MSFAASFDDALLPPDHRAALEEVCTVVVDDFLDDMGTLAADPQAWDDTYLSGYLPRRFRDDYTPVFAREFLVCTVVVGWKLAQPQWAGIACLEEALALNTLVQAAAVRLEDGGTQPDFGPFLAAALSSTAAGALFADAPGGVDESELGRRLERAGEPPDEWLTPFDGESIVHPYLASPEAFDEDDDQPK